MTKVKVIQPEDTPVEKEILATAITKASAALEELSKSGLNRKAIVILVSHKTRMFQSQVDKVLDSLADLKKDYCA